MGGLIDDYNSSLSILMLGLYRVLVETFGFSYLPFRIAKMLVVVVVPIAFYVSNRRVLTAPLAGAHDPPPALAGRCERLPRRAEPPLGRPGGIGCAAALNRGRRSDGLLAASLTFALASTSCGIAVAAACLVHNLVFGAWWRRWVATVLPLAAWLLWWAFYWDPPPGDIGRPTVGVAAGYVWDLVYKSFEDVALGSWVVAIVLMIAFVIRAASMLRAGRQEAANLLAWTSAALVWAGGLALTRWFLVDLESSPFRYRLPTVCFLLLAVIPRRPVRWPAGLVQRFDRRWAVAIAVGVLVVGGARATVVRADLQESARRLTLYGQASRGEAFALGLVPEVIPPDQDLGFLYGDLTASEARDLIEHYGYPFERDLAQADHAMQENGFAKIVRSGRREEVQCQPLTEPFEVDRSAFYLWSPDDEWSVEVRRFGSEWQKSRRGNERSGAGRATRRPLSRHPVRGASAGCL